MRFAFCIEQNVPRFDVPMENAVLVRIVDSTRHFRDQFHRLPDGHRGSPDYFVKLSALDKFHAEVARAITLADFVDWNDARMIEAGRSLGFKAKALQVRFASPLTKANDF